MVDTTDLWMDGHLALVDLLCLVLVTNFQLLLKAAGCCSDDSAAWLVGSETGLFVVILGKDHTEVLLRCGQEQVADTCMELVVVPSRVCSVPAFLVVVWRESLGLIGSSSPLPSCSGLWASSVGGGRQHRRGLPRPGNPNFLLDRQAGLFLCRPPALDFLGTGTWTSATLCGPGLTRDL